MLQTRAAQILAFWGGVGVVGGACHDQHAAKKTSGDFSSVEALRGAHHQEIEAICLPAVKAGANTPTALAQDQVSGVVRLTGDNAAVLTEAGAGSLEFALAKDWKEPDYLGREVLRDTPSFIPLCLWAIDPHSGSIPYSFGYVDGARQSADETRKDVEAAVARFVKLEYVVLIHVVAYDAGHLAAEARIIGRTGAEHGGFRFEATGSDAALPDNARNAFAAALAAQIPGSTLEIPARTP